MAFTLTAASGTLQLHVTFFTLNSCIMRRSSCTHCGCLHM